MLTKRISPFVSDLSLQNLATTRFPELSMSSDSLPAGMQRIIIGPNQLLTPHFHPDTNETTICLRGSGIVGIVEPDTNCNNPIGSKLIESCIIANDVVFLPQGYPHYFKNTSSIHEMELLLTFENFNFNVITVADIIKQLPNTVTKAVKESVPNAGHAPIINY